MIKSIPIADCDIVPVQANSDSRGCLFEIFRESWDGAFKTVQWNACASSAGVIRGVHVHSDYHEFYTLPRGRVMLGLSDIRKSSPTFGQSVQFDWADTDGVAIVVPIGVAHVVYFVEDSVLAFGLSDYWTKELDILGCRWDAPELGFDFPAQNPLQSERDKSSGEYHRMVEEFASFQQQLGQKQSASLLACNS